MGGKICQICPETCNILVQQDIEASTQEARRLGVRFVQAEIPGGEQKPDGSWPNGRWYLALAKPAQEVVKHGFLLGSHFRDVSGLSDADIGNLARICNVVGVTHASDEDKLLRSEILSKAPFFGEVPMLDLDVNKSGDPAENRIEAIVWAQRIDEVTDQYGLGKPLWCTSGRTGIHGDLIAPDGLKDPLLAQAYAVQIRAMAKKLGLPLTSQHRTKEGRPPVVLDDTIHGRSGSGAGSVWRLLGGAHGKNGEIKKPIDIGRGFSQVSPVPGDRVILQGVIDKLKKLALPDIPLIPKPDVEQPKKLHVIQKLVTAGTNALKRVAEVLRIMCPPAGQRHDFRLGAAALLLMAGIPANVAADTLAVTQDVQDAQKAVYTTQGRLAAGLPVKGPNHPDLRGLFGPERISKLRSALEEDLNEHGVPRSERRVAAQHGFSWREKQFLDRVRVAGPAHIARLFERILECGILANHVECAEHKLQAVIPVGVCENKLCPKCGPKRAMAYRDFIRANWPEHVAVATVKTLPDMPKDKGVLAAKNKAMKRLPKYGYRARPDMDVEPIRWLLGVDQAVFFAEARSLDTLRAIDPEAEVLTRDQAAEFFTNVWSSQGAFFESAVRTMSGDILFMPWTRRVSNSTGANKPAQITLPLPGRDAIRAIVKNRFASVNATEITTCQTCGKLCDVFLVHESTGRLAGSRYDGTLFTNLEALDAIKRAKRFKKPFQAYIVPPPD